MSWLSDLVTKAEHAMGKLTRDDVVALLAQDKLKYETLRAACRRDKECLPLIWNDPASPFGPREVTDPAGRAVLRAYRQRYWFEVVGPLSKENFAEIHFPADLHGACFVLKACELIERDRVTTLKEPIKWVEVMREGGVVASRVVPLYSGAILSLAQIADLAPEDDPAAVVAALRKFRPETLRLVFPFAVPMGDLLLQALGFEALRAPWAWLQRTSRYDGQRILSTGDVDFPSSPDPEAGVVDVAVFRAVYAMTGEKDWKALLRFLKTCHVSIPNTLFLCRAILGANRAEVSDRIAKRNQVAVKAYGLLPLTRDDECLERYLWLQGFARESKKFGPQRQANETGAAASALANLAQVAGYPDVTRLEWAMEAGLAQPAETDEVTIGPYRVALVVADEGVTLTAYHGEHPLKFVPPAVRKDPAYTALQERATALKAQGARFRATFERMMTEEAPLAPADLPRLAALPLARRLLPRLLFRLAPDQFGWYDPDADRFVGLGGTALPAPAEVCIAHPYHLYHAGGLASWQREVVRLRLTQPFKQVFRELYLLTPAEEATGTCSRRFAGHTLDPRVAARLFQARGWSLDPGDCVIPTKWLPAGLRAEFYFTDAWHYLSSCETITSDEIVFAPRRADVGTRLLLTALPPVAFSETMRDADLVVSVAGRGAEAACSEETYTLRREVITALLASLPHVRVAGHYAYVQGTRAHYRVHLGSAAIHFDPGEALCIVPARKLEGRVYLPFAETEEKLTEVVSKVLLLSDDAAITDKTILSQLAAHGRGMR